MRSPCRFLAFALCLACTLRAEGQGRPEFRPAVLGSGPDSLINRIDTEALLKNGQKDGAIMFCSQIDQDGHALASWTYRGSPGSELLEKELMAKLKDAKFPPAIYEHQPVGVLMFASVLFSAENSPHIQIFLNQDGKALQAKADFIGPQPVFGADSKFTGLHWPNVQMPVLLTSAIVDLTINVDEKGNLKDIDVLREEPPLLGFGVSALEEFRDAKFIPAFLSGAVEASATALPVCYKLGERE
ncbi:MAG: hypothetical protein ACR2HH_00160 [Chthoniobacterales bacterium]